MTDDVYQLDSNNFFIKNSILPAPKCGWVDCNNLAEPGEGRCEQHHEIAYRICSIGGCYKRHDARGWCSTHYKRWQTTGSVDSSRPLAPNKKRMECKVNSCTKLNVSTKLTSDYWLMHHLIVGKPGKDRCVDHINRDKLDNRKKNLRIVTMRINTLNRGIQSNNKSGYRGVFYDKYYKGWRPVIGKDRKNTYGGLYDTAKEAAEKYAEMFKNTYGDLKVVMK